MFVFLNLFNSFVCYKSVVDALADDEDSKSNRRGRTRYAVDIERT